MIQTALTFGQAPLNAPDSVALSNTWTKMVQALSSKKNTEIKEASFEKIDCLWCMKQQQRSDANSFDFAIPIDTFISKIYDLIPDSRMWAVIKSDERPQFWLHHTGVYEVAIHTYKTNELANGHEGAHHIFQFEKVGDSFKLWGFTSVP